MERPPPPLRTLTATTRTAQMALLIGLTSAILILILGGVLVALSRRRHRRHGWRPSATPLVFMPVEGSEAVDVRPVPLAPLADQRPGPGADATADPSTVRPQRIQEPERVAVDERTHMRQEPMVAAGGGGHLAAGGAPHSASAPTLVMPRRRHAHARAADGAFMGTLRVLPGRLVPEDRSLLRDDIRFIAQEGAVEHRFTLGRAEGEPREHVQLASPTVSRQHALLVFAGGGWTITNLSDTNPVRLNGVDIAGRNAVPLADGDLVEMGELLLRFRD